MIHLSILTVLPLWQTIYKTTKFAILPNYPIIFRKGVITIWNSCQWQPNGTNGNPLAPTAIDLMAPMVHPIAIGANDDHHWCNSNGFIGAILWWRVFHNRHWKPKASMTSLASIVYPFNNWCKWWFIGAISVIDAIGVNSANESIGDPLASLMPMVSMAPLATLVQLAIHRNHCRHRHYFQHCHHFRTYVSSSYAMDYHCHY